MRDALPCVDVCVGVSSPGDGSVSEWQGLQNLVNIYAEQRYFDCTVNLLGARCQDSNLGTHGGFNRSYSHHYSPSDWRNSYRCGGRLELKVRIRIWCQWTLLFEIVALPSHI